MKHAIPIAILGLLLTACSGTPASQESAPTASGCDTSDYSYSVGTTEGAAGTSYTTLVFTNTSSHTCTLQSSPTAQAVFGSDKARVGPEAEEMPIPDHGESVTLKAGASANVVYGIATASNYPEADCVAQPSDGVVVTYGTVSAYFALPKYEVCTSLASTRISGFGNGATN